MESRHRPTRMSGAAVLAVLVCGLSVGCGDQPLGLSGSSESAQVQGAVGRGFAPRATGTVEIVWPGGLHRDVPVGEEKLAFAEFDAFPATSRKSAHGSFTYRVLNADYSPHREIVATVLGAVVDRERSKAWFVAQVVSDTRICSGGHDDGGCSGGHDDGGTHDDGGCSDGHDDGTHDDGGCSGGHDDGGTHDDGGCSGNSGGDHGDGGQSSLGGRGLPGKDPRVGQIVVVKVHDLGTPGTNGDGIAWKWFAPDTEVDLGVEPRCMCKKEIIGGNLVVHSAG